jgi:hypothetical protein
MQRASEAGEGVSEMLKRIYIASEYSAKSDAQRLANVHKQLRAYNRLILHDYFPFCPLLSHYANEHHFRATGQRIPYDMWLRYDLIWLAQCEALLYLGSSPGADKEKAEAERLGLPVYSTVEEILEVRAQ